MGRSHAVGTQPRPPRGAPGHGRDRGTVSRGGARFTVTPEHVAALTAPTATGAARFPSWAPLASVTAPVTVTVTVGPDGTARGAVAVPSAVLTEAEREHAEAERTHGKDVAAVAALIGKRGAATEAARDALAALTVADRRTVAATVAADATGV